MVEHKGMGFQLTWNEVGVWKEVLLFLAEYYLASKEQPSKLPKTIFSWEKK